jgi:hypothetical protein
VQIMSYRKIPTALFAIVLLPGFWFSWVVAASAEKSAVQVQGAWIVGPGGFLPNPDKCGPSGIEAFGTATGRDTLGGVFEVSGDYCVVQIEQPGTWLLFDQEFTGTYLSGEQWTLRTEDFVAVGSPPPLCVEVPEKPVKFTIDGYTGEHVGGRMKGHSTFIWRSSLCPTLTDPPSIVSFEGVFTPNAPDCGLGFELALLLPVVIWLRRRRSLRP